MKDFQPINPDASGTQWSDAEKATLRQIARRSPRKDELLTLFPGRTLASIRIHLCRTRRELEIPKRGNVDNLHSFTGPPMLPKNAKGIDDKWQEKWRNRAVQANAAYLAALQQQAA